MGPPCPSIIALHVILEKNIRVFLVTVALCAGTARAQGPGVGYWPATLLENAWGLEKGAWMLVSGLEFEEDSGDFPTTKVPFRFHHGLTDDVVLTAGAQLVRFNLGEYTAWGGSESVVGLKARIFRGGGRQPSVQLKSEVILPGGGLSAVSAAVAGGANLSWSFGNWGLHLNGKYSAVSENHKQLGVSEIDEWRVAAGLDHLIRSLDWNWIVAVVGAQPVRDKPNEWSLEVASRLPISGAWALNIGGAGGLRQKGIDWLYRFMIDYRF